MAFLLYYHNSSTTFPRVSRKSASSLSVAISFQHEDGNPAASPAAPAGHLSRNETAPQAIRHQSLWQSGRQFRQARRAFTFYISAPDSAPLSISISPCHISVPDFFIPLHISFAMENKSGNWHSSHDEIHLLRARPSDRPPMPRGVSDGRNPLPPDTPHLLTAPLLGPCRSRWISLNSSVLPIRTTEETFRHRAPEKDCT